MRQKALGKDTTDTDAPWRGTEWTLEEAHACAAASGRCLVVIDGFVVDVTDYLKEHVRRSRSERAHTLNLTCMWESRAGRSYSEAMPCKGSKMDSRRGTRAGLLVED